MSATDLTNPVGEPYRSGTGLSRTIPVSSSTQIPLLSPDTTPGEQLYAPTPVPNAQDVARSFLNCWKLAASLGLGAALIAVIVTWMALPTMRPAYRAQALIRIRATEPRLVFPTFLDDKADFGTYRQTQAELIKTRRIISDSLKDARLAQLEAVRQDPERVMRWLEKDLKVENLENSEFTRISLVGVDP